MAALASTASISIVAIRAEQLRREAAVAVTQDGGAPASGEFAEKCATAALQPRAESNKLHPAIETRQPIEVRCSALLGFGREHCGGRSAHLRAQAKGMSASGVSRTRSAAARNASAENRARLRSSSASSNALVAPAASRAAARGCADAAHSYKKKSPAREQNACIESCRRVRPPDRRKRPSHCAGRTRGRSSIDSHRAMQLQLSQARAAKATAGIQKTQIAEPGAARACGRCHAGSTHPAVNSTPTRNSLPGKERGHWSGNCHALRPECTPEK